jgi:hypothetical protein
MELAEDKYLRTEVIRCYDFLDALLLLRVCVYNVY